MGQRFNVQSFLAEMRQEQREDTASLREGQEALTARMEDGFKVVGETISRHVLEDTKAFAGIDKRLEVVENTRLAVRWVGATVIIALLAAAADFLFVHLPKFVKP